VHWLSFTNDFVWLVVQVLEMRPSGSTGRELERGQALEFDFNKVELVLVQGRIS
jgi:hypothetical protein